ncbi:MAG: flagellar biosynthesis protein FlhF [Clostridia bacterium]|nr:flagellar biosynthesis protein FlhF [Clostridia bacterium]MDH7573471.1 flagellar biosynthesis protein FlhF [Clostridia bacterium]
MKIKRYLVKSMPEAMAQIRRDLGTEAVIIGTRRVRQRGVRGWFTPPWLEVTAAADTRPPEPSSTALKREVEEIKGLLQKVSGHLGLAEPEPDALLRWRDLLQQIEVNTEITERLLEGMEDSLRGSGGEDGNLWREEMAERLARFLAPAWPGKPPGRIMAFIGPTGVGKTTTLAKLAARYCLLEKKKVGLVTMDTYRIGAVQQLAIYGEILGVPVETAFTPQELRQKVEAFGDRDVVLIDTVGRSPRNDLRLAELRAFLDTLQQVDSFLVLSCTTRAGDLEEAVARFGQLRPSWLIFTKLDETRCRGAIVNAVASTGLPVAYITNGQNVPDDIVRTGPERLARLILGVD